jgi:hypothetical protein
MRGNLMALKLFSVGDRHLRMLRHKLLKWFRMGLSLIALALAACLGRGDPSIESPISEETDSFEYVSPTPGSDVPDSSIPYPVEPTPSQTPKVPFLNTTPGIAVIVSATVVFAFLVAGVVWYYVKKKPFGKMSDESWHDPMRYIIDSELLDDSPPGQDDQLFSDAGLRAPLKPQQSGSAAKGRTGRIRK